MKTVFPIFRSELLPFGFVPAVLEPYFDLGLRQPEAAGEVSSLWRRQILLVVELLLELQNLQVREGCPRALVFAERARAVRGCRVGAIGPDRF